MMYGKITAFFAEKGFGFIQDECGESLYFHICKVSNPDLVKKDAKVTFEAGNNSKGPSAHAVKVIPDSKYLNIANVKIKISSIHTFQCYTQEVPIETKINKEKTVLSVGLLMNKIRPQDHAAPITTRTLRMLSITTYHHVIHTFSEDELDIDEALQTLNKLSG